MEVSKVLNLYFHFSYLCLLVGGKQVFTRQFKSANRGKCFLYHNIQVKNADSGGNLTVFPSISCLMGRAFSIFRQKMDGATQSEMDIKLFNPALTNVYSLKSAFLKWEKMTNFL